MTDLPPEGTNVLRPDADAASVSLRRAKSRARWAILWERLWPPAAAILTAIGLFLAASWFGLWLSLPPLGRAIGLVLFAILGVAAAIPLAFLRWPREADLLRRLDLNTGLAHRPATAIADTMAGGATDSWSQALWRAHVEKALAAARSLKVGIPAPNLPARDPIAVRALVLALVIAAFFSAGSDRYRRIAAAFDWHGVVMPANFRLDAWVSPPTYTGKPPVILPGIRPGERTQSNVAAVSVPVGSVLVVRSSGSTGFDIATSGGVAEAGGDQRPQAPAGTEEKRYTISERGTAAVRGIAGDTITWAFNAIPDKPPSIAFSKDPEPQARGSLLLAYKIEDDYGAVEAKAEFALKERDGVKARPLFAPPEMALVMPQPRTKNGTAQTIKDLSEHPWAGAEVEVTLVARDEANNEGRSAPASVTLPQRIFTKPLARAVIEQRRELALDAEAKDRVLIALDALGIAPEIFTPEAGQFIGLRTIFYALSRARSDDQLRDVVKDLWAFATQLEDGNVSDAEQRLRQAQEALRQALERGASEEEIKKLMEELRAALDKFLQALAEEMRKNPQTARPLDRNTRELRSQDLKSMLDRLEQLSRQGNKDAARQLLDQLQSMLENLQMARPGQGGEDGDDDMMSALDELGNMIREQQQLRDKTFREGQDQRRNRGQQGQQGRQGQQGQQPGDQKGMGELRQSQQALRDRLKKLLDDMKQKGLGRPSQQGQDKGQQGEGGEGDDPLGQAGEAMGDAEGALGDGNADSAVDGQGRALDAMKKGAQGLAQQLQQQMGEGQGPGPGRPGGPQNRAQQETDPLGRPLRGRDYGDDTTVKVPGEIDAQRARRILEELRKRFGEAMRPQIELDYIERLLKDY